jgi:hypothetical protein
LKGFLEQRALLYLADGYTTTATNSVYKPCLLRVPNFTKHGDDNTQLQKDTPGCHLELQGNVIPYLSTNIAWHYSCEKKIACKELQAILKSKFVLSHCYFAKAANLAATPFFLSGMLPSS